MTETIPQPRTEAAADQIEDTAPASAKPGLLVLAPLRLEANAVRRGLTQPTSHVLRTGMGATRAKKSAGKRTPHPFGAMVVMGTAAGLSDDLSPGDLVVAVRSDRRRDHGRAARRRPARGGAAPGRAERPGGAHDHGAKAGQGGRSGRGSPPTATWPPTWRRPRCSAAPAGARWPSSGRSPTPGSGRAWSAAGSRRCGRCARPRRSRRSGPPPAGSGPCCSPGRGRSARGGAGHRDR